MKTITITDELRLAALDLIYGRTEADEIEADMIAEYNASKECDAYQYFIFKSLILYLIDKEAGAFEWGCHCHGC